MAREGASARRTEHWERIYRERPATAVSWYQPDPRPSLEMLDALQVGPEARIVDIGGGSSLLVDRLLDAGHHSVTVLDVSDAALERSRHRLGERAALVDWVEHDLLTWRPERQFDVWHDRALLHFMTAPEDREAYLAVLRAALAPDGAVIIATFAADGPERCSGLPVERYDGARLAALLGPGLEVVETRREVHRTPAGADQAFTWLGLRRRR